MNNLKKYIEDKKLILPNYDNLNIVELVRFLYNRYGNNFKKNKHTNFLEQAIPNKKHTLFILIDGMGSNLINILNEDSILKKNKITDMLTVSPSSTGCVLTSLATATYPEEHGIIGWYNYNLEHNIDYIPLCFIDRKNSKDLRKLNIKPSDIFKLESKLNQLNVSTTVLYNENIYNSIYSNYVANNNIRKSYKNLHDAFDQIIDITSKDEDTFTYLYIPNIDTLEHNYGFNSKEVLNEIFNIENQIKRLNNKDLVTVITADHGQTNTTNDIIMDFKKYDKYFYAYPGIDFKMATYYINKGMEEEFIKEFNKDFKDKMYLFETKEFIENNIFGPNNNSKSIENSLGEYISLCSDNANFINSPDTDEYYGKIKGGHSGLTKDEMIIPLIVIK